MTSVRSCAQVRVIFRTKGNLHRDMLVLQLLRVMDHLWLEAGLITRTQLCGYHVSPTLQQGGVVQVLPRCRTLWEISKDGDGALANFVLPHWTHLQRQKSASLQRRVTFSSNRSLLSMEASRKRVPSTPSSNRDSGDMGTPRSRSSVEALRDAHPLVCSTAAAFVACYILGMSERHDDNIAVTRDGRLVFLDFYHKFGTRPNTSKDGKRLDAPRVGMSPVIAEFLKAGGASREKAFVTKCCQFFMQLRSQPDPILDLLRMAVGDMPKRK